MEGKMIMLAFGVLTMLLGVSNVNAISCQEAVATLNPCLSFLVGKEAMPSAACCLGAEKVKEEATTTQIRRDLCSCFKQAAASFGIIADKAKQIPDLCHVQVPVPIDPNIDCTKVPA
ncbi:non-specific lipid-transfer protein-like [Euphorbia lathyris]|uniref:non-specific lipid-transfer protein-like n=1 Tax=Euphorbia lathyris TaxID=212925 RepID=UPI0033137539